MTATLWTVIGYMGQLFLLLLLAILLFIVLAGLGLAIWRAVAKLLHRQPKYRPEQDLEKYVREVNAISASQYGSGTHDREVFRAGANWAWGYFHRKHS